MRQIRFGFIARFAPTVLSAFQIGRLVAVSSVSSIFIIISPMATLAIFRTLASHDALEWLGARADKITVLNGGALSLATPFWSPQQRQATAET